MDLRKSFSKPFRRLKDKLPGGSRKQDRRSGNEDGRKGSDANIDGSEAIQRKLYPHSEVLVNAKGTEESGPSQGESRVDGGRFDDPPMFTSSILHIGEPDGM